MEPRSIAILDAGSPVIRGLTGRLRRMGYPVLPCKTPDHAERLLRNPARSVTAAMIPVDLPAFDLARALRFLRRLEPSRELTFIATGRRPARDVRRLLRGAGVEIALWEPVDDHSLRFQANRALASSEIVLGDRVRLRAPTDWPVSVWTGKRRKSARIYSLSGAGAYLATDRPSLPGTRLALQIPVGPAPGRLGARVSMTNVPGHFLRDNLPIGMGVRFEDADPHLVDALDLWVRERMQALGF